MRSIFVPSLLLLVLPSLPAPEAVPAMIGFATAVALQGDDLFVGHPGTATNWQFNPSRPGRVHLFARTPSGKWEETGALAPADVRTADGFGSSLVVEGDLLAVGAADQGSGAVYLFARSAGAWSEIAKLTLPDGNAGDRFGAALSLQNGLLLVGAPNRNSSRGAVFAFREVRGTWAGVGRLGAGQQEGSYYGAAMAMDGDRVAIGAPGVRDVGAQPSGDIAGSVVLFRRRPNDNWSGAGTLSAPAGVSAMGFALALHGDSLLVSAPHTNNNAGLVIEFQAVGDAWRATGIVKPERPFTQTGFGASLARNGTTLFVGAPLTGGRGGAVHIFERGGFGWTERQVLTDQAGESASFFGRGLSISGARIAIAGPTADFWEGTSWVYEPGRTGWERTSVVTPRGVSVTAITGETRCEGDAVHGFPCAQVDLQAFLPLDAIGARRGMMLNDLWGWTDSETSREYALVGRVDGTSFVDVTDPAHPSYLGDLPMHAGSRPNKWRDMKTYKDHLYVVADNGGAHGMQVFDLTRLRRITGAPVTFTEDAHYDRFAESHNIIINEETGFAYTVGNGGGGESCGGGLHMIDIREPTRPVFAGCFADAAVGSRRTGGVHDAQCVVYRGPDVRYRGKEICFNSAETALAIVDVTDKKAVRTVAVASYPNTSYAHQGWLTEDQKYFFMGDEGDETDGTVSRTRTLGWDLTDLEDPVLQTQFFGTTAATDHNLYIKGRYMYQSNYASGLRVIDIADPAHPHEVGFFDSVPGDDNGPGFAGSWSNYPFFPSGTIVFTSRKEGLFVVKHRPKQLTP